MTNIVPTNPPKPYQTYQPKIYRDQGGNRLTVKPGGIIRFLTGSVFQSGSETNGTSAVQVAHPTQLVLAETLAPPHQTLLTFTGAVVTMTDATTAGNQGTLDIYDFPAGNIVILGAVVALTLTKGSGGLTSTAAAVASLGSAVVGTGDATLTGTEADIVASTVATLVAGVGVFNAQNTTVPVFDGTNTNTKVNLNIAVPDAGSTANDTITVSGTVLLTWINTGDN